MLKPQRHMPALAKASSWKLNRNHVTWLATVLLSPYKLFTCSSSQQHLEASAVLQAGDLSQGFFNCMSIQPPGLVSCSKKTSKNESLLSGDLSFWQWDLHLCKKMHSDLQINLLDYLYSKVWLNKAISTKTGEGPQGRHPLPVPRW